MMKGSESLAVATLGPQSESSHAAARSADARALWVLGLACLFVYAYFYQGPGYNQHAHFATARAIVEHGTFEITPYKEFTGDVSHVDGRLYSSKAPGLALLAAPAYFVLYHAEHLAGFDVNATRVWTFNIYLLTVWTSALPTVGLVLALYVYLRREGLSVRAGLLLAGSLAFGTLLFPYAGSMMVQNAVACCLFVAWLLVREPTPHGLLAAGALLGVAVLCDHLVAPLVVVYGLAFLAQRPTLAQVARLAAGLIVAAAALMAFNRATFGSPFATSYKFVDPHFTQPGLFMGVLDWPQLPRVYWLTLHPHRGLFYCCPLLLLAPFGLRAGSTWRRTIVETVLPLVVFGYFFLFNLSFRGWTGGWGVGPRYLIPTIPFLFVFVARAALRFPRLSAVLIAVSILNMFTVAAVCLMVPAKDFGPPMRLDPVVECYRRLFGWHTIAMHHGSFNLGQLMKMPGLSSLLLPLAALVAFWWFAFARRPKAGLSGVLHGAEQDGGRS